MTGLTKKEVEESRAKYGSNVLTPPKRESLFIKFLACFADPIIRILLVALLFSVGISVYQFVCEEGSVSLFFQPLGIFLAIILATLVGFLLEQRNEKTFQSLNEVNDDTLVKVIRDSNVSQVRRRDIVVGDIVILETGEEIPADCELIDSFNLIVNESSLTGELQCNKSHKPDFITGETTYPHNHVLKGCTIIEGYCTAKVFAVGDMTESGHVFTAAQVAEGAQTPLGAKLNKLADFITKVSYTLAFLIVIGRAIHWFLIDPPLFFNWLSFVKFLLDTVMIAVTLIVVAVPEGLPMAINLSLAFSMRKLMKEKTLPRTIHSCETMGAVTVICTDKTGTLTRNRMEVAEWRTLQGAEKRVAEAIACNSTANLDFSTSSCRTIGNPTEGALLGWLNDNQHVNYLDVRNVSPMIDRVPFSTELKYMGTLVRSSFDGRRVLYVKGAPEIILTMCAVSDSEMSDITNTLKSMQGRAMRTIAMAYKVIDDDEAAFQDGRVVASSLTFLGIFGISDPVRQEVPGAIARCREAGIDVKIVTGDVVETAWQIGLQCGIIKEDDCRERAVMTGAEFGALTDEELKGRVRDLKILSRARPNDKQRLVNILRSMDEVVAVTGDGTNDAPALNAADVGLSMGDGTAVAKEASDMTILDSSFGSICNAVIWGRSLYKNIQRFVMFQMTVNVVACLVVLIGAFVGTKSPLTVAQMLWVNLIMDTFAALALASLPPSHRVMYERPRRSSDSIISQGMAMRIVGVGAFFLASLMIVLFFLKYYNFDSLYSLFANNLRPSDVSELTAYEVSLFFTFFVMLQFWNMFNAKAFMTHCSAFRKLSSCRGFMWIALVILVGQFLIVTFGGAMFSVTPLPVSDWVIIIAMTSLVLFVPELVRFICRSKR
ncbi:MAG: calcium-translocating P-type ATPase, PMCA-type [Paludibacteraceae bacterium]|nr:calcium-translocating P-type ATPase, PMCA-type [Paludibacteraceae bacterium]